MKDIINNIEVKMEKAIESYNKKEMLVDAIFWKSVLLDFRSLKKILKDKQVL